MISRIFPVSFALLLWFVTVHSAFAADLWIGSCRNVTAGVDGNLKLQVNEQAGRVTGFISISGWLLGSGEIKGRRAGSRIEFVSTDSTDGLTITWSGIVKADGRISGEYFIKPHPALGLPAQSGEWSVSLYLGSSEKGATDEARFKKLFIFDLEKDLNATSPLADGSVTSGARVLFEEIHPVGIPVAVTVDSVDVEWKHGSTTYTQADLHKYRVTITLYWHGPIQKFGRTRIALDYNAELGAWTGQEILSTTGITKSGARKVAVAIGAFVAKAALDAFLSQN